MRRREFIAGLGAAAWPVVVRAQQPNRVRRVGVLMPYYENDPVAKPQFSAFTEALAELGWTDGRNLRIDVRWAGDDINRIGPLAQELVGSQPDIIQVTSTPATAAGLVARLDRPSGNVTGFAILEASLGGKWLELLSEIAPDLKRVATLFNPDTTLVSIFMPSLETAARSHKVVPITTPIHSDAEIETAIIALGHEPGGGLIVLPDSFSITHRASIISAAARNNVPAIYFQSAFARDGGLLSYGFNFADPFRRAAAYVDRILRGAKVAELPVQFPTKYEMVINLKTAKALGMTVSQSILLRADEVIE
jgi:putative tryptophan/tyrosine transport system substrate-binding protein